LSLPNSRCPFFSTACSLFSQKPGDVGLLTASDRDTLPDGRLADLRVTLTACAEPPIHRYD
jgi:hypothetical protein